MTRGGSTAVAGGSKKASGAGAAQDAIAGAASARTKQTAASLKSFNQYAFKENERVLCFHGPLIYEANVLNATDVTLDDLDAKGLEEGKEVGHHYFVHYKGWAKRWDEWVPESRVLKLTEENLARQNHLKEETAMALKASKGGPAKGDTGPSHRSQQDTSAAEKNRKRIKETVDREEEYLRKQEIKLPIPDNLKVQLVDDWQFVTKRQQLVTLPRTPTVRSILQDWLQQRIAQQTNNQRFEDEARETCEGLMLYFNAALGNALLYRLEREQYRTLLHDMPEKDVCDVYGAEHLLRLFVSLPALVAHTAMDQRAMNTLKEHIADLLKYMVKHAKSLFQVEYEQAAPEYLANLRE